MKHVDVLPTIEYANRKFPTACWSLVTGLCMLISVLSGSCSAENETDKANNNNVDKRNERLQLVFITTCVNEDFFKPVQKGIHDAAELMNVEYTFVGTEGVDAQGQVKLMEEAIQNGAHGIALNIIDSVVFDDVV